MAELPTSISLEAIASGIVGLLLAGGLIKRVLDGYIEAKKATKSSPAGAMITAMSVSWDRDQQERFLQIMESIDKSLATQAASQVSLANQQQHDMQAQMAWLVDKLGSTPDPRVQRRRTPKKGPKPGL